MKSEDTPCLVTVVEVLHQKLQFIKFTKNSNFGISFIIKDMTYFSNMDIDLQVNWYSMRENIRLSTYLLKIKFVIMVQPNT